MLQPPVYSQQISALTEYMVSALAAWSQRTRPRPFDLGAAISELTLSLTVQAFAGVALPDAQEGASLFRTHVRTVHALMWTFHFLAQQPAFQQRVRQELDGTLGGRSPTFADLAHLPYAGMVLQKALRYGSPPAQSPPPPLAAARQFVIHPRAAPWNQPARDPATTEPRIHRCLALLEGHLALAMIVQRYELAALSWGATYDPAPSLWVTLERRA